MSTLSALHRQQLLAGTRAEGVSDTTLMRLIQANLLAVQQVSPYAPLEIKRMDLDAEPVAGIIRHLKSTGRLVLTGDPSAEQARLFQENQ
jgi:hypothetical protein